eukprot:TRINITY_DN13187_c0_g1_i1.p1 TRINITY_DN13187_c0_g1~~TRINITY_DN13187_c0_g1_i1.p1  ORF type:complete len:392 (-),score=53.56 TRINITY_DN13187_c0_g1_i1:460-1506(-)
MASTTARDDPVSPDSSSEQGDADDVCACCQDALGKRRLNPRHHCRVCQKPVCGPCSPALVPVEGIKGMARCCLVCAVNATKAAEIKRRLLRLHACLCDFGGDTSKASMTAPDVQTALSRCEQCVSSDGLFAAVRETEAKAKSLKSASFSLGRHLHGDIGSKDLPADAEECTFEQATQFCEEALAKLQEKPDQSGAISSFVSALYNRTLASSLSPVTSPGPSSFVCAPSNWAQDTKCWVCQALLGKRRLKPRHHCRLCGKTVCGACSPNFVKMPYFEKAQRACSRCVDEMQQAKASDVQHRMKRIADQLVALSGVQQITSAHNPTLADSVLLSEQALLSIAAAQRTAPK